MHHLLPEDALEQLDDIDQMFHDGLLTQKVQGAVSEETSLTDVQCFWFAKTYLLAFVVVGCGRAQKTCVSTCWPVVLSSSSFCKESGR